LSSIFFVDVDVELQMLYLYRLLLLCLCFSSIHAWADCRDLGILVLRSSAVSKSVYQPYLENDCVREANLSFAEVDYNPLTANQLRDLRMIQAVAEEAAKASSRGLIVFAYSEAGKFAAKLASLNSHVKALFLMDPVDGTPPFSSPRRFPIFLDEKFPVLKIPTTVLESELGSKFKRFGYSCVPEDMGPKRFYRHVESSYLNKVVLEGLGHSDFLRREKTSLVELVCGKGVVPHDEALARILEHWRAFLVLTAQQL
jgi:hypothetical protein